jgi:hypothetical protein
MKVNALKEISAELLLLVYSGIVAWRSLYALNGLQVTNQR